MTHTLLVVLATVALAAGESGTILDPANAGPDFATQGEYAGSAGSAKLGAQVIARGGGKFHLVLLAGGLPGDGWDGGARLEADGQRADSGVVFTGKGFDARLTDSALTGTQAGTAFTLPRVERRSPTLGLKAPEGALVLFDGSNEAAWKPGKNNFPTQAGLLAGGRASVQEFGDCQLHLEFRTPFMPAASGQGRGNSGVYLLSRYEVQVLDSFGLVPAKNECGAVYSVAAPKLNMCFPPLAWQTYDIELTAPRLTDGKKTANARLTARLNGVLIHDHVEVPGPTTAAPGSGDVAQAPLYLQDHGNPVYYRNVWLLPKAAKP